MTQLNEIFGALGSARLREIVDHFVWRMRCDRQLEPYLTGKDDLTPAFLGWLQMEFGGPSVNDGRDLSHAQAHLRDAFILPVTPATFYAMGSHLILIMSAANVPGWIVDAIAMHWMDLSPRVIPSAA